jgi:putative membrane protein
MRLSDQDEARIVEAIGKAEKTTSGEIRCVLASEVVDPRPAALVSAAIAALILPMLALLFGLQPDALTRLFGGWSIGHLAARDAEIATALVIYIGLEAAVFIAVLMLASWAPLRRALTPKAVLTARVHGAALQQFAALGLHLTRDRTGILLFASLHDHRAEVLADEGIYRLAPPEVWDEVVAAMISGLQRRSPADGFVAAVERTGEILRACLPPRRDDADELPNEVVQTRPT